jgi:hypothetical protein
MSAIQTRNVAGPLIKLSIFAAVTVVLTGLLAGALGAFAPDGTPYRARFTDVTGVLPGDDVRIAGVKVGRVTAVELVGADTAELAFTVRNAIPVPANVHATIRYRNLVGQRYVALTNEAVPRFAGPVAPTSYGGRGLLLIDSVADRWGSLVLADGKVVWAALEDDEDDESFRTGKHLDSAGMGDPGRG